jgi:hypothetical protein
LTTLVDGQLQDEPLSLEKFIDCVYIREINGQDEHDQGEVSSKEEPFVHEGVMNDVEAAVWGWPRKICSAEARLHFVYWLDERDFRPLHELTRERVLIKLKDDLSHPLSAHGVVEGNLMIDSIAVEELSEKAIRDLDTRTWNS